MQNKINIITIFITFVLGTAFGLFLQTPEIPAKEEKAGNKTEYAFSGEGRQTLGPINLKEGLAIIHAKNSTGPSDTFSINVTRDENGDGKLDSGEGWTGVGISVGYKAAEAYNGKISFKAYNSDYYISVDGGKWEITVTQPEKLKKNAKKMKKFNGTGDSVTEKFFLKEGVNRFRATYTGDGNFIITLFDENGNSTSRLVNEIGNTDLVFEYKNVFDGNYIFAVTAKGSWSIEAR